MSERCSTISHDIQAARENLVVATNSDEGIVLRVCRLEQEEDSVTFAVDGYDGDFTAFLADPYPGGETIVYGPDDLEFCHVGTVQQVVEYVLQKLNDRLVRRTSLQDTLSAVVSEPDLHDNEEAIDDEDWQEIVSDTPMEPKLLHDITQVRSMFGTDAATYAQLSLETWRLRLGCPLGSCTQLKAPSFCSGGKNESSLLDETTASAWGLHAKRRLVIEVHLPATGYLGKNMDPAGIIRSVCQDGYPKFALEKQMVQILSDFCTAALSSGGHSSITRCTTPSGVEYGPEELEVLQKYEAKKVSMIQEAQDCHDFGFLVNLIRYARLRITTMHEYCAICDQPFAVPPMLLRTVCCRDLCTYQFGEFGDKITSAEGVNTQAEIVDLLVCMLMRAALSQRRDLILEPYPCVFGGEDGKEMIFHPKVKDNARLQKTVKAILTLRQECGGSMGASWSALKSRMGVEAASLVSWVVASNRSYLAPLGDDQRIDSFQTPYQYLLISAPPDKEREFQALKKKHGSVFAYHGSPAENWHSILRNGLKNASDTKLMTTGKAYGAGVYLATDSQTSLHYAVRSAGWSLANLGISSGRRESEERLGAKRQKTGNRFLDNVEEMVMLAVCEVIDHSSLKRHGSIWVAPMESTVITRFFLVYTDPSKLPKVNTPISGLESQIRECMLKLRVGIV